MSKRAYGHMLMFDYIFETAPEMEMIERNAYDVTDNTYV